MVLSRTVQVIFGMGFALGLYGFWTDAETRLGEIDEGCCFSWLRAAESVRLNEGSESIRKSLLSLIQCTLRETLSVMIAR